MLTVRAPFAGAPPLCTMSLLASGNGIVILHASLPLTLLLLVRHRHVCSKYICVMLTSAQAMPMLVVNMGAEMMFILEQRLKAQSISPDKSGKVGWPQCLSCDIAQCRLTFCMLPYPAGAE